MVLGQGWGGGGGCYLDRAYFFTESLRVSLPISRGNIPGIQGPENRPPTRFSLSVTLSADKVAAVLPVKVLAWPVSPTMH